MITRNIVLASLVLILSGCEPGAPSAEVTGSKGYALAQQNGCFNCHEIDTESYCPKWRDIANKYREDKSAEARLVDKVATGGSGVWGEMVMPPHPQISESDRKTLIKFVLSL